MKALRLAITLIPAAIGILFLLLVGGCTVQMLIAGPRHVDSGPVSIGRIPAEARNIDYIEPIPFAPADYASFAISEAGYLRWVEEWRTRQPKLPPPVRGEATALVLNPATGKLDRPLFSNAWRSEYHIQDRALDLIYDLDGKRAYFYHSSR